MPEIHIGRGTTNLGVFEVEEIKAGLAKGRFFLTDLGWKEGMAGWKPLSEFEELSQAPTHEHLEPISGEPEGGVPPLQGAPIAGEGLPWDHRDQIGLVQAFTETVKVVLTEPGRAFSIMDQEGGLASPLLFTLIGGCIGGIAALIYAQIFIHSPAYAAQAALLPLKLRAIIHASSGLGGLIWIPFKTVIWAFISSAVVHLCLMLVGGAKRPFETTFRVLCFSMGASNVLFAIPICGGVLAGVWGLIVMVIGLAKAHDIQTGRSLTAVLLPVICCCAFLTAVSLVVFQAALHTSN